MLNITFKVQSWKWKSWSRCGLPAEWLSSVWGVAHYELFSRRYPRCSCMVSKLCFVRNTLTQAKMWYLAQILYFCSSKMDFQKKNKQAAQVVCALICSHVAAVLHVVSGCFYAALPSLLLHSPPPQHVSALIGFSLLPGSLTEPWHDWIFNLLIAFLGISIVVYT